MDSVDRWKEHFESSLVIVGELAEQPVVEVGARAHFLEGGDLVDRAGLQGWVASESAEGSAREGRAAVVIVEGIAGLESLSEGLDPVLFAPAKQESLVRGVLGIEGQSGGASVLLLGRLREVVCRTGTDRILYFRNTCFYYYSNLKG